jgi:two-component system chemotaxis sensor kinase CheA
MSIDMSQFYQVFFEEAQEHLANMESLLLALDVDHPDGEDLNAIFRAAHSIKGSSGTFGFTDLQDVTHILENLLDRIRKGELGLRAEMIDAFLDAGDVLKDMLAGHRGEGGADPAAVRAVTEHLSRLTGDAPVAGVQVPVTADPVVAAVEPVAAATGWEAQFAVDAEGDAAIAAVENLVGELSAHWPVRILRRASGPGGLWCLALGADTDLDMVRGMLEFIARSDSIRISASGSAGGSADDSDGAYGFFSEPSATVASAEEESYGFFVDPVTPALAATGADETFGFFDAAPGVPGAAPSAPTSVAVAVATELAATAGSEGEGFGFFVDVPKPVPPPPAPTEVVSVEAAPVAPVPERRAKPRTDASDASIRVGVDKVDQLINLVGELVITQAMLAQSAGGVDPVAFERLFNGLAQLERNTRDLQESVMSIRMMPMSVVFSRFPRVVRDLSNKLGKQVELKTSGEGTELDKGLIERITDPLTHLIRNSLDHGIEMPEVRAAKGKQPMGTITLKAYHQSGNIVIEVGDDGAGLNRQKILGKARERGLAVSDGMSDHEVWQLIFEAGFSTADQVTEVSGRGVGMDVVKRNIAAMGGRVEIASMEGIGTRMTVKLPLTLAILDGMSVAVGKETYIIPLGYVIESLQAERDMIKSVSGVERLIQVRGEYLPVVTLFEVFRIPGAVTRFEHGIMVIVEVDGTKAALFVDALVGQHQVVIKSLEANYRKVGGVSGATIMGDGHVALILDVAALAHMARTAPSAPNPLHLAA